MGCPVCVVTGFLGGWLGGYFFGIHSPEKFNEKVFSAFLSASLTLITIVALKAIFNISPCQGVDPPLRKIAFVGIQTFLLGNIYSIFVNYLLTCRKVI